MLRRLTIVYMIRLQREVRLLGTDVSRTYVCLRRPGLRVYLVEASGLTVESRAMFPLCRSDARDGFWNVSVVMRGAYVVRRESEHELLQGRAVCEPLAMDERWQPGLQLLVVEWDRRYGEPVPFGDFQLGTSRSGLQALCDELALAELPEQRGELVVRVVNALRSLGVPLRRVEAAELAELPSKVDQVASGLNRCLTSLSEQPMWVDWSDRISERQYRRLLKQCRQWLALRDDSFRSTLSAIRLQYVVSLLSVPGAGLDRIAASVGYGSSRALLAALRRAGLANSDALRRAIRVGSLP